MNPYVLLALLAVILIGVARSIYRRERAAQDAERAAPAPEAKPRVPAAAKAAARPEKPVPSHTEGKPPAEIDIQRAKIEAEALRDTRLQETRREIKEMDLQHLRAAVVMSEILDRPVSLRRRGNLR